MNLPVYKLPGHGLFATRRSLFKQRRSRSSSPSRTATQNNRIRIMYSNLGVSVITGYFPSRKCLARLSQRRTQSIMRKNWIRENPDAYGCVHLFSLLCLCYNSCLIQRCLAKQMFSQVESAVRVPRPTLRPPLQSILRERVTGSLMAPAHMFHR